MANQFCKAFSQDFFAKLLRRPRTALQLPDTQTLTKALVAGARFVAMPATEKLCK